MIVMKQSKRIRVFAIGFLGGCVIAAGFAFLRNAGQSETELPPLPEWSTLLEPPALPELPFPDAESVKAWESPESGQTRWLLKRADKSLWQLTMGAEGSTQLIRADALVADGNPGIEIPALRAGLEHNGFEILSFDLRETRFTLSANPFLPDEIEESIRLLNDRKPYILEARPIPWAE